MLCIQDMIDTIHDIKVHFHFTHYVNHGGIEKYKNSTLCTYQNLLTIGGIEEIPSSEVVFWHVYRKGRFE